MPKATPTGNAGEQLARKLLNVTAGEGHVLIALEKVEDALAEQVCDDADVVSEVKCVPKMDAFVPVVLVVLREGGQNSQLDAASLSVFLYGANDLDGDVRVSLAVPGLDNLAEGALTKQSHDIVAFCEVGAVDDEVMSVFVVDLVMPRGNSLQAKGVSGNVQ